MYLSKYEGFGMPPLEAMTFGCPVITVSSTSIPEVCGDSVVYVDPQNYYEVTKKMFELVNDNVLTSKLIFKGVERTKLFTSVNSAKLFLKHISKKSESNS
jgi:glycosyltransferase involved in cell wall biosynthesis